MANDCAGKPHLIARWVVAAIVAIGAAGCGGSPTSPSGQPASSSAPKVTPGAWAVLGASTTAGFSASTPAQAWVSRLQSAVAGSGVTITNLAVPGAVTYNWMSLSAPVPPGRMAPFPQNNIDAAMALQPKLLLMNATNNDLVLQYSADETVANILAIRAIAVAGGATVLMLSTQPRNLSDAARAQLPIIDARLAPTFGSCFVDIRTPLAGAGGLLAPAYDSGDGIHPNDAGHGVIFQRVDAALQSGRCVTAPH